MSEDELKSQNEKLRIALRKINNDFSVERSLWETKLNETEERCGIIPELEEKLKDVDVLLEAVEERD